MSAQHTPGPWHVGEQGYIESEYGEVARYCGWKQGDDETMPNALLLAAAPELLQALQELLAEAEAHDFHNARSFGFQLAEDAVRKARGEEPIARFPTVGERGVW